MAMPATTRIKSKARKTTNTRLETPESTVAKNSSQDTIRVSRLPSLERVLLLVVDQLALAAC